MPTYLSIAQNYTTWSFYNLEKHRIHKPPTTYGNMEKEERKTILGTASKEISSAKKHTSSKCASRRKEECTDICDEYHSQTHCKRTAHHQEFLRRRRNRRERQTYNVHHFKSDLLYVYAMAAKISTQKSRCLGVEMPNPTPLVVSLCVVPSSEASSDRVTPFLRDTEIHEASRKFKKKPFPLKTILPRRRPVHVNKSPPLDEAIWVRERWVAVALSITKAHGQSTRAYHEYIFKKNLENACHSPIAESQDQVNKQNIKLTCNNASRVPRSSKKHWTS